MPTLHDEREIAVTVPKDKSEVVASFDPSDFDAPTGREEEWRFTPLRRIKPLLSALAVVDGAEVTISGDRRLVGTDRANGPIQPGEWLVPVDIASAFAWSGSPQDTFITVPAGEDVAEPLTISINGQSSSYQRIRLTVEHDATATIIIDHRGHGSHSENVEIEIGPRAQLKVILIQDWDRDAIHLARVHAHVGRDASLTQVVATFGGDVVRVVSTVDYDGPGGSADLFGAYFADAGQHLEHRLFVDHNAAHCRSNVVYKGALQGEHAHTVWIGDVLIRAHAVGTETYEMNRNLVLSEGARADSVPNLEIETGEVVGAGHASATGRFDDEQLFYLQARGIDPVTARKLVVTGFFSDVIDRIPDDGIRARLWRSVDAEIAANQEESV